MNLYLLSFVVNDDRFVASKDGYLLCSLRVVNRRFKHITNWPILRVSLKPNN